MSKENTPQITWTFEETAAAIQITSRHLRGLIAKGQGPKSVSLGRRIVFLPDTVQAWLRDREGLAA